MLRSPGRTCRMLAVVLASVLIVAACGSSKKKSTTKAGAARGNVDGVLKIGLLAPQTGDLAALGPPQFKGAQLAITRAESMMTSDKGDAIMGAASSGTTKAIMDKITGAGVVECSPSNTS